MNIIGRVNEQGIIEQSINSGRPEFMVVYGRRRVGKTFLVKEYFNNRFAFYATGVLDKNMRGQLKAFKESLVEYGDEDKTIPQDWFEAFRRLRHLMEKENVARDEISGRRVIFLDEVPWMDTARSDFKSALDFFWNSWASSQKDILLIVCGSATSWIINNILFDTGGFYNRVTRRLYIAPFSLKECEEFYDSNGIKLSRSQIIDSYMVFGGIPYYLNLLDKRLSLVQNIDALVIKEQGHLHYEYDHLFRSLFKKPNNHFNIIKTLAKNKNGMVRTELVEKSGVSNGEGLTKTLNELEQCGFIRKYNNYTKKTKGLFYQLIDPFVLFSHNFLKEMVVESWQTYHKSPSYYSWRGNAFEMVCLNHIAQIKNALGISGVSSSEYSWSSKLKKRGVQIDLLLDRKDDVINICEMKYTDEDFVIDAKYEKELVHKVNVFRQEVKTDKALLLTLVTVKKLKRNAYSDVIQNVVSADDLFQV